LSSASINIARAVGPALGGVLVAAAGPGAAFAFNAFSFVGTMVVLYRWRRTPRASALPAERFLGAIRAGIRYTLHAPVLQAVLVRTGVFILFGSALWAMLPVRARLDLGYDPTRYGLLLGAIGGGALVGAGILSKVSKKLSPDMKVAAATVLFAAVTTVLALSSGFAILCTAMFAGGVAWIAVVSSFNVAAQTAVSHWVRARAMATYLLVFQGGMAIGALLWGTLATHAGTATTLLCAASGLILGLVAKRWFRITTGAGIDLMPSMHWPTPLGHETPEQGQGPVMIMVEYRIDPADADAFVPALQALGHIRRRDGAVQWGVYRDTADAGRYVETFFLESWVEHLRQHERITVNDRMLEDRVLAFHKGRNRPAASHFTYADGKQTGKDAGRRSPDES
jgi:predicted MFS family arabinose efflux permease